MYKSEEIIQGKLIITIKIEDGWRFYPISDVNHMFTQSEIIF